LAWLATAPAWAAEGAASGPGYLLRLAVGLIIVLAALGALAWLLRRLGGGGLGRSGPVRVLGSAPVGQRERVLLVEVGGQQLVVGVAPGNVRTLHVLDEPVAAAEPSAGAPAPGGAFARHLRNALQRTGAK
jgi:flagellar protein FliO/FliZ